MDILARYTNQVTFGNSIELMRELPPKCVDLLIADPPYGIGFTGKKSGYNRDSECVIGGYRDIEPEHYTDFSLDWIKESARVMKDNASGYIFSGWNHLEDVLHGIRVSDLKTQNHLIWTYQFPPFAWKKYVTSHIHILFVVKNEKRYYFDRRDQYAKDAFFMKKTYSPKTMKNATKLPENLIRKLMMYSSLPGFMVLDPFLGNGTTAVVAEKHKRNWIGFEINEKMEPIIQKNIEDARIPKGLSRFLRG